MKKRKSTWLKNRGYLHLSPQIDIRTKRDEVLSKVKNPDFVSKHAFYPLIHSVIKERRFKLVDPDTHLKAHSFGGKQTVKERPLHYATHIDALIFGYYADIILKKYESHLQENTIVSECITAYRQIPDPDNIGKFKSTINFANEVFLAIRSRATPECVVLKFDIKSFFSTINHKILKRAWAHILDLKSLPADHYNVYKASTRFSYILKDDLRIYDTKHGRRAGFDEKRLADIRKSGNVCFFYSNSDFRENIKEGKIKLSKYPFRDGEKHPIGIPQGLPISATLANLYLLEFDKKVVSQIVVPYGSYYRRYSDDIIIICNRDEAAKIENLVYEFIKDSQIIISKEKTEKFIFKTSYTKDEKKYLTSLKVDGESLKERSPLTYLGFEFNGEQMLIKSSNLARFYRRMITAVKRKASRAVKLTIMNPNTSPVIYRNQLIRLYSNISLNKMKIINKRKELVKTKYGYFVYKSIPYEKKFRSNYFSYARRASRIMNQECIQNQLNKHRNMFNSCIKRQITKNSKNNNF